MSEQLQPVLVLPVYRGGDKFRRALASMRPAESYFRRIVVSLNASRGSSDENIIEEYRATGSSKVEVIQTNAELPWIPHQYFWLDYLSKTGERARDWLLWFAHDDQLRLRGLHSIADVDRSWRLTEGTIYLGPWGMRYDPPGGLYDGPVDAPLESWTSFPLAGPLRLPVSKWIAQQLEQPTYINMSGCITQLASFQAIRQFPIPKPGGMRIEMATAAAPINLHVQELSQPVVITHTSTSTDRTTYAPVARRDDVHLVAWLANYLMRHPSAIPPIARAAASLASRSLRHVAQRNSFVREDWRYRSTLPN